MLCKGLWCGELSWVSKFLFVVVIILVNLVKMSKLGVNGIVVIFCSIRRGKKWKINGEEIRKFFIILFIVVGVIECVCCVNEY